MCCGPEGFLEFQKHALFKTIEWKKLEQMECPSPFAPNTEKANFERGPDIEEIFETRSADVLKFRKRRAIDPSKLSPLHAKIENEFVDFNFEKYTPDTSPSRVSVFSVEDVEGEDGAGVKFVPDDG
jgi:hypothetical protein